MDETDRAAVGGKKIILIDDVISTGSTLRGMETLVEQAGGRVVQIAAVFTEGEHDWTHVVALGNLPVFRS
jgi:adenine phosphoribosyltransferase